MAAAAVVDVIMLLDVRATMHDLGRKMMRMKLGRESTGSCHRTSQQLAYEAIERWRRGQLHLLSLLHC